MVTPKNQASVDSSQEVIDLTELSDTSNTQTICGPSQIICVSESAPVSTHPSNTQALIVLSDEETEISNDSNTFANNPSRNARNTVVAFRSYGNAQIFDYNYIREPYVDVREQEGDSLIQSDETEFDSNINRSLVETSDLAQGIGDVPSLTKETPLTTTEPLADNKSSENGENNMGIKCSICLDNPQKLTTTFCGHLFCDECIHRSIKTPSKVCPVCRKPLTQKRMRVLQLRVLPNVDSGSSKEYERRKKVKLSISN